MPTLVRLASPQSHLAHTVKLLAHCSTLYLRFTSHAVVSESLQAGRR